MVYEVPITPNASADNDAEAAAKCWRIRKIAGSRERIITWLESQGEYEAVKEILARKAGQT